MRHQGTLICSPGESSELRCVNSAGGEPDLTTETLQGGTARLVSALAIPAYLLSGWEPPYFYLIPECYIVRLSCRFFPSVESDQARRQLQIQGLVLILIATSSPLFNSSSPKAFNPPPSISRPFRRPSRRLPHLPHLKPLPDLRSPPDLPPLAEPAFVPHPRVEKEPHGLGRSRRARFRWVSLQVSARGPLPVGRPLGGAGAGGGDQEDAGAQGEHVGEGGRERRCGNRREHLCESFASETGRAAEGELTGSMQSTFIRQEIARFAGVPERQMARDEKALIM